MKLEEQALIDFVDQWGHPMVPKSYVAHIDDDQVFLGEWVRTQREKYKSGTLMKDEVYFLESVNQWEWDPTNSSNSKKLLLQEALVQFFSRENKRDIPIDHIEIIDDEPVKLDEWLDAIYRFRSKIIINITKRIPGLEERPPLEDIHERFLQFRTILGDSAKGGDEGDDQFVQEIFLQADNDDSAKGGDEEDAQSRNPLSEWANDPDIWEAAAQQLVVDSYQMYLKEVNWYFNVRK